MKNSLSLNCDAASTLSASWLTEAMPRSTTTMSAPREYRSALAPRIELSAEHGERVGGRGGGGEPAVVERGPGLAFALRDLDLEAVFLGEVRSGFGSRPPLATIRPPYPAYSLISICSVLSFGT